MAFVPTAHGIRPTGALPPRVRDLGHVSATLRAFAGQASRGPLGPKAHADLLLSLGHEEQVLADAKASAEKLTRKPSTSVVQRQACAEINRAAAQLAETRAALEALPASGSRRRQVFVYGPKEQAALDTLATRMDVAERAGQQLSGHHRHALEYGEPATQALDVAAFDAALQDPSLRSALQRDDFAPARFVARFGPTLARPFLGEATFVNPEDLPKQGPYILDFTHGHGLLDGPGILARVGGDLESPFRTVMRSFGGFGGALLRKLLIPAGIIPTRYGKGRGAPALAAMELAIQRGHVVGIAGEGRVVVGDIVGVERNGAARAALDQNVPVYPVVVYGAKPSAAPGAQGKKGLTLVVGDKVDPAGAPTTERNVEVLVDAIQVSKQAAWDLARELHVGSAKV